MRTSDNKYVRVYTTNIPTTYRNYTLWHDHQYRQGMVWESIGYNQPPHTSYFIGELEGITMAPPPLTMTDRTEVGNGGTIDSSLDGKHVIVCETNDTQVSISDGAQPWVATFNVPSWVQGTNSTITNGNAKINYVYYTCNVTGGAFTGSTRLVKQGDGILTLPKVDMTHTGNTDVWAGTMNFDGTMKLSALWLNRFAELNSDGGEFLSIKMDYGSKLHPGRADHKGTVTMQTLQLGFGSRVVFDLYSNDLTADQVIAQQMSIETKSWQYGPTYKTPVFEFVIHGTDEIAEGKYLLGSIGSVSGDLTTIKIEGTGTKKKAELLLEEGKLYLQVSGMRDNTTIIWNGNESNVWEMSGAANFILADDATGTEATFVNGDIVQFTDNASSTSVSLNGELEADTIVVDNTTKSYTFTGTGALVGNTSLVKRGKGGLIMRNDNTYTGGNRISGGFVTVTSLANANQAKGNLGAMTTAASKFVIENGGELRTTAAVTNGSAIQFASEEGGIINNSADFIVDRAMTGTTATKKGNGWMKLNVSNSNLNKLVVAAGTVQCINANAPAKTVEYQGGTLRENTSTSYAVNVPKSKQGSWYLANRSTYTNKVTGEGTLTIYCVTEKGTNYYATRTPIQCNFADFEGTIKPTSSLDDPAVLRFTLNTSGGMPKGAMDIDANVEVQNSGKTFRIGKVTGTGALGGSCTFSNGTSVGANTWQVGNDANWTTSVKVTSNANLVKLGTGKTTWNGKNSNTGTTAITEGELCLGTNAGLGTGTLTVGANGTLSGNNNKSALTNSAINVNGVLSPGTFAGATSGTILLDSKPLTINESGVLVIGVVRPTSAVTNGCTDVEGISRLTINGTIRIVPSSSHKLQVGDSIRIFQAASFAGTPKFDMQGGIEWDTSRISEGLLFVTAITDGIHSITTHSRPANIYDLNGRLVRSQANSTEGLRAGVYLMNGRKIVVK